MSRARTIAALFALALCTGCGQTPVAPEPGLDPAVAAREGLLPTSIGRGPEFVPAAGAVGPCSAGAVQGRYRAHLELFGRRHAVVIPAGIGLRPPLAREQHRIVDASCRGVARTLEPTGVIDFDRTGLTLGDLFAVWGEPLSSRRMAGFAGPVSAFVAGRRVSGDPASIPLRDGAQIVLQVGGYIPPHRQFRFPPRG
ncbi:hypothetical protein OM076_14980 [Solirubrobacter ginsenosidimutans]|uniref:Uncharacterized protein n=1 Tax=Solirubrobacter ginsenosidimutans TaxID=490573 RepID=A0A9X3S0Q9_9ACTN|nr:hypothetical protein [Solirubrobacter ginsenosidimutans]MDA0161579.1 hypothetical protein [Solirubrobacter ginsenosidimutans]